jgi:2,3-bisphosphoglycerate-independent phosphoglycerate mutase
MLLDGAGKPATSHSTNPVPLIITGLENENLSLRRGGVLADIAPTILQIMKIGQPEMMTGTTLLQEHGV